MVNNLDGRLIELRDAALDDQYKDIKVLKHQILHFFKKFHENKAALDDLDKKCEEMNAKD